MRDLSLSRRTLTRKMRRETGLSSAQWQRRACLAFALPRMMKGERVTTIAFDLGYASLGAFTTMFGRATGMAPSVYCEAVGRPPNERNA
jgi:AraC-like DNA-binding protein